MRTGEIAPAPDSHWRLRGCTCGAAAVYLAEGTGWRVRCRACGKETGIHAIRHEAQVDWNRHLAAPPEKVRVVPTFG